MKVVNMYRHPVSLKVITANGVEFAHLAPRSTIDLPDNVQLDNNHLVNYPNIKVQGVRSMAQPPVLFKHVEEE